MSTIVADCPRCHANSMTHDVLSSIHTRTDYDWMRIFEIFCVCRSCKKGSILVVAQKEYDDRTLGTRRLEEFDDAINRYLNIKGHISIKDEINIEIPQYLPSNIESVYIEGATCLSVNCANAAATMFRLCIDLATKIILPQEDINGLNPNIRRILGLRLKWLFDNKYLPDSIKDLANCIKEDGNDGAHEGTLEITVAEDILDFSKILLERLYTEPMRIKLANERRLERRGGKISQT